MGPRNHVLDGVPDPPLGCISVLHAHMLMRPILTDRVAWSVVLSVYLAANALLHVEHEIEYFQMRS